MEVVWIFVDDQSSSDNGVVAEHCWLIGAPDSACNSSAVSIAIINMICCVLIRPEREKVTRVTEIPNPVLEAMLFRTKFQVATSSGTVFAIPRICADLECMLLARVRHVEHVSPNEDW